MQYMRGKRKQQHYMPPRDSAAINLHEQTTMNSKDVDRANNISAGGGTNGNGSATTSEDKRHLEAMSSRKRKRNSYSEQDGGGGEAMDIDDKVEQDADALNGDKGSDGTTSLLPSLPSEEMIKLREVFEQQFSLEILLKNEERKAIEAEKAKVETSIKQLEQCVVAGEAYPETPNRYHNYYGQYIEYGTRSIAHHVPNHHNGNNGHAIPVAPRPQRNAAIKAAHRSNSTGNVCLAKNEQGKIVRVTCPDCSRFDFSNVQGFINHCRIAHKIEYASHDDAVRECGVEFDLSELGADGEPLNPRQMHMTRPGIQSILSTSSTLSGKLPETQPSYASSTVKRKSSNTSLIDEIEQNNEFTAAFNEYVASPVTTRARAQSFNSMHNNDFSSAVISGLNSSAISQHSTGNRRNSLPGPSKKNGKSKRGAKTRAAARKSVPNGTLSPTETDTPPALRNLRKYTQQTSPLDLDIDNFVEEMRREKHNNMLLGDDGISISGDSDSEEKPEAKKPTRGARRPAASSRITSNWVAPVPGLVELPATRLRNRQLKEKERLANAAKEETDPTPSEKSSSTTPAAPALIKVNSNLLDVEAADSNVVIPRARQASGTGRRKPQKKSPMEQQAFLSTLPLRMKGRRRRTSTNTPKPDLSKSTAERAVQSTNDDRDSDATSSDEEPGRLVFKAKGVDGTMTPTSLAPASGFIGLSGGKDAPTVEYVSPVKGPSDLVARPNTMDGTSRFYHKRRIKIGNTSKYIPVYKRSPKMGKYTHKWMIYFVSPVYSPPISTFLSSVTIFLDESFPLPRIIELRVPPFRWISYGWGEFNLNIRLVFCDPAKNKPMDVVHPLRLDPGKSGREVEGYIGYFDVDIDRNTVFLPGESNIEFDPIPTMAEVEKEQEDPNAVVPVIPAPMQSTGQNQSAQEDADPDTIRVAEMQDMIKLEPFTGQLTSERPTPSKRNSFSDDSVIERVTTLDEEDVSEILHALRPYHEQIQQSVVKFPLITDDETFPYSTAMSWPQYSSWSIEKQKSVEWHRARVMQADILENLPEDVYDDASEVITIKSIVLWCRRNHCGPPLPKTDFLEYCRFCGLLVETTPKKRRKKSPSLGVDAYCCCAKDCKKELASLLKTSSNVQDLINRHSDHIEIDDGSMAPSLKPGQLRNLISQMDVKTMRWVWTTMLQLELSGTQDHRNEDVSQMAADEEPLAATSVMAHATKLFLSSLIQLARPSPRSHNVEDDDEVIIVGTTSQIDPARTYPLITPIHILQGIRERAEFDFLTNAGMAAGSSQSGAGN